MINSIIHDVRSAIEKQTGCTKPIPERRFHKHDQYLTYGMKTADYHQLMKFFRPRFLELSFAQRLQLAQALTGIHVGELGHAGVFVLEISVKELAPVHFSLLSEVVDDFRSWSQVDGFCISVMQPLLKKYPQQTLSLLDEWSQSPNRFKRRTSVVTFVRKISVIGEFTEDLLRLCERLILDDEDIVQKGVGWALKDNLRYQPERLLPYIKDLRRRGVSSTITLYAIRDLKGAEREDVLAIKAEK